MPYVATKTSLPGVIILTPRVFGDERGFFFESFNARDFHEATGVDAQFVQDNHSRSGRNVLRGLHYQQQHGQGKLIRVLAGEILDVAVDVRRTSPTFGKWTSASLSADNRQQLWVPVGFAHGFLVISEVAEVAYKTTDYWYPEHERILRWDDPQVGIPWPLDGQPILAGKDASAPGLEAVDRA